MSRKRQKYYDYKLLIISAFAAASLLHRRPASWHEISEAERSPSLYRSGGGRLMVIE